MSKVKKSAYPTHVVGKAHPVETQGVTNSSQPLMSEGESGTLSTKQQQPTAATSNNPTNLDPSDQPSVTGCVAQPTPDLLNCEEILSPTSNVDAGSPSLRKAKVVEETPTPEEFRKAAIEAYLEDYLNKTGSFYYENVQVLLIEKKFVFYEVKVTVSLEDVLFPSDEFCDLKDCYVGGVAPKATLLENDTVVYEGVTFGFKWSKEKEEEAFNFYTNYDK